MKSIKPLTYCLLFSLLFSLTLQAQNSNSLYGIVRKNFYHTVVSPFDSTLTYQQFDSARIRLGHINPATGYVSNTGNFTYNQAVNLTGSSLNPHDSTYVFIGGSQLSTLNLSTGNIIYQTPLTNPIAASYFDNFRFNTSDSTLYGLARRTLFDSLTNSYTGEIYLAKVNTQNGVITQISPISVATGFAYTGSAIDPYQMVYYFSTGNYLIGLDLYTGLVYSKSLIGLSANSYFDNFTFSCADSSIYGLVRQNYFSYQIIPGFPLDSMQVLDSVSIKLGKINPATGGVTVVSPTTVAHGGFSINTGSAIDPNLMIYYYSNGAEIIGISMQTGSIASKQPFTFDDGTYFDLMRNFENCMTATATRQSPVINAINQVSPHLYSMIYPNPFSSKLNLLHSTGQENYTLVNTLGQVIWAGKNLEKQNFSYLTKGFYFIKIGNETFKLIKDDY